MTACQIVVIFFERYSGHHVAAAKIQTSQAVIERSSRTTAKFGPLRQMILEKPFFNDGQ